MDASTKSEADFSAIGAGIRAGYQWIFDSGFTLDVNAGGSYKSYKYKWKSTTDEAYYEDKLKGNGIMPAGSVGIGYSF